MRDLVRKKKGRALGSREMQKVEPRAAEGVRCLSRHAGVSWQAKAEKDGLEASPDRGAARCVGIVLPPPWHGHVAVAA